jgi:hypothetical protein
MCSAVNKESVTALQCTFCIQFHSAGWFHVLIITVSKMLEALLDASKQVGLEVKPDKTKYMLMSYCQSGMEAEHKR